MPALRIKLPNAPEVTHILTGERITVGRRPDNTIQIIDGSVSAHHAEFIAVNGHYRLHDLDSTNLCFVEGQPVKDYHLLSDCQIGFGTVQCQFDSSAADQEEEAHLSPAQLEKDAAFLRAENAELLGKLNTLQRRIDILSSARLVTGKMDHAPGSAVADSLKAVAGERDDLRHQNAGLKLELDQLREELLLTIRERDTARQAAELLQSERVALHRQLEVYTDKKRTQKLDFPGAPSQPNGSVGSDGETPEVAPVFADLIQPTKNLRSVIERLSAAPEANAILHELAGQSARLVEQSAEVGEHAFGRVARGLDDLLRDLVVQGTALKAATLRTISQAGDLLGKLLEGTSPERAKLLPHARVLAVDDDPDLLATVVAALQLAQIQTDSCRSGEEALAVVASRNFDLLLADVGLPGMDGTAFCAKARELPAYRKTPVVFLTVSDSLDKRAEASLSGGSDFIGKPFNVFELALKVQTWTFKHQLGVI
jgi:CheY-like chemotaxis protein